MCAAGPPTCDIPDRLRAASNAQEKTARKLYSKIPWGCLCMEEGRRVYFLRVVSCIFQILLFCNQKHRPNKVAKGEKVAQEELCHTLCETLASPGPGELREATSWTALGPLTSCLCFSRAGPGVWLVGSVPSVQAERTAFLTRLASVAPGQEGPQRQAVT